MKINLGQNVIKKLPLFVYQQGFMRKPVDMLKQFKKPQQGYKKPLAKAEKVEHIYRALGNGVLLGRTRDDHFIHLVDYQKRSPLIREIGRLREFTFRQVGEGTGAKRDLDKYDKLYRHLVLWNQQDQTIAGAYRIGECQAILQQKGAKGLYTSTLYKYKKAMMPYLEQGLELGRSFVHPDYWGKASLDYLWQGIGAYLRYQPNLRYVIGPVSLSADYPKALADELVYYYQRYYPAKKKLAKAYHPYVLADQDIAHFDDKYKTLNRLEGFECLQKSFSSQGYKVPVLFKQYTGLYEEGGIQLLGFSVDPNFSNCIDGLMLGDLTYLKAKKRARYIDKV